MTNWTKEQLDVHYQRLQCDWQKPVDQFVSGNEMVQTKPRQLLSGYRSKTEAAFSAHLDLQVRAGAILSWKYEAVTLRLAPGVSYTPDFVVFYAAGFHFIEVKGRKGSGFWSRPVGKIKVKLAAEMFPQFRFEVVWPGERMGTWESVRIGAAE